MYDTNYNDIIRNAAGAVSSTITDNYVDSTLSAMSSLFECLLAANNDTFCFAGQNISDLNGIVEEVLHKIFTEDIDLSDGYRLELKGVYNSRLDTRLELKAFGTDDDEVYFDITVIKFYPVNSQAVRLAIANYLDAAYANNDNNDSTLEDIETLTEKQNPRIEIVRSVLTSAAITDCVQEFVNKHELAEEEAERVIAETSKTLAAINTGNQPCPFLISESFTTEGIDSYPELTRTINNIDSYAEHRLNASINMLKGIVSANIYTNDARRTRRNEAGNKDNNPRS